MLVVLLGMSFLTFILTNLAPGDPVRTMYASTGVMPDEEMIQKTREEMGLNRPIPVQYLNWLTDCLKGDFGTSYSFGKPVGELLLSRLLPTVKLTLLSLVFMLAFSVPLGMAAAVYQNKWPDVLVRIVTFFGVSMPNFWVGLLLLLVFAVKLAWFPVLSSGGDLKSMVLPAATLAFAMTAKYTRQVRTAVLEELNQDYVTGARALGMKESRILWKNVFPNALLPLITMLGLSLGSLLGGTAVVEVIFSCPGLGNLAVSAIMKYDYPLIQGYVLWVSLMYMLINWLVDIFCSLLDPRTRESVSVERCVHGKGGNA